MKQYILLSALLLIASFVALPASGQQATPPAGGSQTTLKATTEEVVLDLVVRDKKGKPVTDLRQDQITVVDNGAKQNLTSFRLVRGTEAISSTGASTKLDPLRQLRLVTLAFEALGDPAQRKTARTAALDLVKGEQGTNVYYSVVVIDTRLLVLQAFTKDKAALDAAIEKATMGVSVGKMISESDAIKAELRRNLNGATVAGDASPNTTVAAATQVAGQTTTNGPPSDPTQQAVMRVMLDMLQMDSAIATDSARMSLAAMKSLVQGLQELPGRKSILYFSSGLYFTSELDVLFNNLKSLANRANVTFYSLDTRGVMMDSQNAGAKSALDSANNAAGTTIMRTGGAVTKDEMNASMNAENAGRANVQLPIRDLAESTGGFLIADSNDLRGPLRQINEEISSYYELTYNPEITKYDGSFRKLAVNADRKDLVIHARNGYFALAPEVRAAGLEAFEMPLLKAISDGVVSHDVEFRAGAVLLRPKADGTDVSLLVEVPLHQLQAKTDPAKKTESVHFSVAALVRDSKGEVVQKVTQDRSFQVTAEQLKMGNFVEKATVVVPPGSYVLESAVMDRESGKLGTHHGAFTVVPASKGVAISSLAGVRSYTPNVKGLDPSEAYQFQGGSITPTLSNSVPKVENAALRLFFTVYQDSAISAKPTVEIELLQGGKVLSKTSLPLPDADKQGRIPYVMTIPAAAIPPGAYVLQATARQGDTVAETRTTVKIEGS
jgi:VWFA-related protein